MCCMLTDSVIPAFTTCTLTTYNPALQLVLCIKDSVHYSSIATHTQILNQAMLKPGHILGVMPSGQPDASISYSKAMVLQDTKCQEDV